MNFNADVLPCLQNIEICIHKLKQLGLLNRDQRCPNCQEMCFQFGGGGEIVHLVSLGGGGGGEILHLIPIFN